MMDMLSVLIALANFSFFSFVAIVISLLRSKEILKRNVELIIASFSMFISTSFIYLEINHFHIFNEPNILFNFIAYSFFSYALFNIATLIRSLYQKSFKRSQILQIGYSVIVGILFVVVTLYSTYQIRTILFVAAFIYPYTIITYAVVKWDKPIYKSPFFYLLIMALYYYIRKVHSVFFLTPYVSYTVDSNTDTYFTLAPMIIVILFFIVYIIELNRIAAYQLNQSSLQLELTLRNVKKASETDPLTGVANRTKLNETMNTHYHNYKTYEVPFSIAIIDVDDFKQINDDFGHLVGDAVLQCITYEFQSIFRRSDIIGRWGGDEFIIILPHTEKEHFSTIRANIETLFQDKTCPEYKHPISISIGFACINEVSTLEELIHTADRRMYQNKHK